VILYGLLPGGKNGRPVYEPVQESADTELLPSQRPDDPSGVSGGLCVPGNQSRRGSADPPGDPQSAQRENPGDSGGESGEDPKRNERFQILIRITGGIAVHGAAAQ